MKPEKRVVNWPQGGVVTREKAIVPPRRFHVGDRVVGGMGLVGTVRREIASDGSRRIYVECDPGQTSTGLEGPEYYFAPWED